MRVTLIHNPLAGADRPVDGKTLKAMIRRAGHEVEYRSSKGKNWAPTLEDPGDVVAVAGGDGTVAKVAQALIGRRVPIAVLPTGTANNVANTLGLVKIPLQQWIADWSTARQIGFDVGVARHASDRTLFVESFGIGLFAATLLAMEDIGKPKNSILAARRKLRKCLQRLAPMNLTVRLDGRDLSGSYLLLEAMNIGFMGPKLNLAPKADPGDGLLDVVLVRHGDHDDLHDYLGKSPKRPAKAPALNIYRGKHLRIVGKQFDSHTDGKTWPANQKKATVLDVRLQRHALTFLRPS